MNILSLFDGMSGAQLAIERRPNKNSILHKAVLKEMGERCATEFEKEY